MNLNQTLYEINTRVWLQKFNRANAKANLADVPAVFWKDLTKKGIDFIWLMGIWKTCDSDIAKYCFDEDLVHNYKRALKDWKKEDVIGSPFAVDSYLINSALGDNKSLLKLKSQLNKKGIRLILDFIPNHFSASSKLLNSNPEIFLSVNKEFFERDSHTFFKPFNNKEKYFAHGRDPFFPAWQDTIQVNIFSNDARKYLIGTLLSLTKLCDGVRCDMAMLLLNNVFKNTWSGVLSKSNVSFPTSEFWKDAIEKVKSKRKDFIFIAEAYWDLEKELQQIGFDYTYDKKLTDLLKSGYVGDVREHLMSDEESQRKSVRFLENHDEERAVTKFGVEKSKAAAIIISTIQGMRFYYDGQFEGKKIKLPVQLGREPEEQPLNGIEKFYDKLISLTTQDIFKKGKWNLLEPLQSWENNDTYKNMLAWIWTLKDEKRLVIVNYSNMISTCRLKLDVRGYDESFELLDLLNEVSYTRSSEEVFHSGLYVELKPFHGHIVAY